MYYMLYCIRLPIGIKNFIFNWTLISGSSHTTLSHTVCSSWWITIFVNVVSFTWQSFSTQSTFSRNSIKTDIGMSHCSKTKWIIKTQSIRCKTISTIFIGLLLILDGWRFILKSIPKKKIFRCITSMNGLNILLLETELKLIEAKYRITNKINSFTFQQLANDLNFLTLAFHVWAMCIQFIFENRISALVAGQLYCSTTYQPALFTFWFLFAKSKRMYRYQNWIICIDEISLQKAKKRNEIILFRHRIKQKENLARRRWEEQQRSEEKNK